MAEGIVESKEEMKKKMQMKKKGKSEMKEKMGEVKESASETKENISNKMQEAKEGASEKKEDISGKIEEAKEGASEKKEDISGKIEEAKEGASEKKEEIEEKVGEVKEEVSEEKEKLEKESKEEGVNPAEKLLNDIVSGFRQRTGEVTDVILDYTEPKASKEAPKKVLKPLVDVLETNDTITIIVDLPGVKKDDIDIGISKNSVEITAMFKEEPEDAKFTQKERSYGKTHRSIKLSTEIKVKEAKAKYGDYTVTITLPKLVEDITKVNIEE